MGITTDTDMITIIIIFFTKLSVLDTAQFQAFRPAVKILIPCFATNTKGLTTTDTTPTTKRTTKPNAEHIFTAPLNNITGNCIALRITSRTDILTKSLPHGSATQR
jgi:hypothetical protein